MKNFFIKIKRIFGFVRIDYSFVIMLVLFLILDDVLFYLIYLIFIVLHELAHLFVAKKLGYLPKRLKLSAFGASLEGFDDFLTSDEIKIVLAGPIFNLLVVILCYLSFWFYPETYCYLSDILNANLSILFFNLLPIFPLDAGRFILCFISRKKRRVEAVKFVKNLSLIMIGVMFFVAMISFLLSFGFTLGFVSLNLCLLLFSSSKETSFKREILLKKKINRLDKGILKKTIFVNECFDERLLLKFIDGEHYFIFVFVNENFEKKREIDEFELLKKLGFI